MKSINHYDKKIIKYFFEMFLIIFLLFAIASSNTKKIIVTCNRNTVKSIKSSRIITPAAEEENFK